MKEYGIKKTDSNQSGLEEITTVHNLIKRRDSAVFFVPLSP